MTEHLQFENKKGFCYENTHIYAYTPQRDVLSFIDFFGLP